MHSLRTTPFFMSEWSDPRFAAVLQQMRLGPPLGPPGGRQRDTQLKSSDAG
jgi:hypothetical protein